MKEENEIEEAEVDINIIEELKTDRDELNTIEIVMISIFVFVIVTSTLVLSFSPRIRNYVTYPLMNQEELTIKNWISITSFSILLGTVGFPMTLHNFMVSSIMKEYIIALSIAITSNVGASLVIFSIGRFLLSYRLKIAFKNNEFYQTLQYAVRKDPLKFAILFKLLLIPHVFKNYALAITDLKFSYFLIATLISNTLLGTIWVTLGHSIRGVVVAVSTDQAPEEMRWILFTRISLILLSLGITIYLFYYGRSIYTEMEAKKRICTRRKSCQLEKLHEYNPRPSILEKYMVDPMLDAEKSK